MRASLTIEGIQELQAANNRAIASLRPDGALGRAIQYSVVEIHRYATTVTHVDTGALRASHRMEINGAEGRVYLDPSTKNPRSGNRVAEYGVIEHERGGSHAFYDRTVAERGPAISERAVAIVSEQIKW